MIRASHPTRSRSDNRHRRSEEPPTVRRHGDRRRRAEAPHRQGRDHMGPEFHRRGRPARHRTARNTTEIKNTTGLHAGKSNIIGMPVALTSTSPHANRWFSMSPGRLLSVYPRQHDPHGQAIRVGLPCGFAEENRGATQSAVVGFAPDEIRVNIHGCDRANRKHHNHCQNPGFRQYTS